MHSITSMHQPRVLSPHPPSSCRVLPLSFSTLRPLQNRLLRPLPAPNPLHLSSLVFLGPSKQTRRCCTRTSLDFSGTFICRTSPTKDWRTLPRMDQGCRRESDPLEEQAAAAAAAMSELFTLRSPSGAVTRSFGSLAGAYCWQSSVVGHLGVVRHPSIRINLIRGAWVGCRVDLPRPLDTPPIPWVCRRPSLDFFRPFDFKYLLYQLRVITPFRRLVCFTECVFGLMFFLFQVFLPELKRSCRVSPSYVVDHVEF